CPPRARELITAHADDVISALKCTGLRHPRRRARLTAYLRSRIAAGDVPHRLPSSLSLPEQAHYLQGTFFN
ncbi:cytochrome P450, partial [Streptomyces sp. TRM76130]|nr:cytochrome P450 [Streptomyces sp. TRM76130]